MLEIEDITQNVLASVLSRFKSLRTCVDAFGRRIAASHTSSENTQQLKHMLIEEWVLLLQEMLHQLVLIYNGSVDMRLLPLRSQRILYGSHVPSLAAPFPVGDIALSFPLETICWRDATEACNIAFYFTIGHPENELTTAKENHKCGKQTYKTKNEK
ncbi:hypothetical protein TNCV_4069781 [Trichonephila clavipes]|nr:hypothetical protein TNCV_4069781 [Trichonephila clavipes]